MFVNLDLMDQQKCRPALHILTVEIPFFSTHLSLLDTDLIYQYTDITAKVSSIHIYRLINPYFQKLHEKVLVHMCALNLPFHPAA